MIDSSTISINYKGNTVLILTNKKLLLNRNLIDCERKFGLKIRIKEKQVLKEVYNTKTILKVFWDGFESTDPSASIY